MRYFLTGLALSTLVGLLIISILKPPPTAPPTTPAIPANLPPAPDYVWSPDFSRLAYQHISPDSPTSTIEIWDQHTQQTTTVHSLAVADHWLSAGVVDLAWLTVDTIAYASIVTDDSLPTWHPIANPTVSTTLWQNRQPIAFSPNLQALLTITSPGPTPSQALTYEIILANNRVVKTKLDALKTTCMWIEKAVLKCYYTSSNNEVVTFTITVSQ